MPEKHTSEMANLPAISSIVGPHLLAYETFFKQADTKGKGNIPALQAANFLKKSGLKESILSEIWDLSDPQGCGYLDKQGFFAALKLISAVQNGHDVNISHLALNIPPPSISHQNAPTTNAIITNAPKDQKDDAEWAIPLTERIKYDQIFHTLDPTNGLLPGSKVKPVLLNSKLPVDVLGHVWDLSDIDGDGSLDKEEFSVAMNLVYKALQKISVPPILPPEMIPPSKRKITNNNPPPQITQTVDNKPPEVVPTAETKPKNDPPISWVVTAHAKAQCDELFTKTDTDKDGFVSGAEIKKIFIKSGLQQNVLAHIWSLCDTKNLGKLNRDQFALAMYLIQQKVKGVEVPPKLTPEMVPPSARRNSLGENVPPPGVVFDMTTPGMKEIENLGMEIDRVKSSKQTLEGERSTLEENAKSLENSLTSMQQEIDVVVNAVKQLNTQKLEAQKRLDDIDAKRHQMEKDMQTMNEQFENTQKKIVDLKDQMANRDNLNKTMEEDLKAKRGELNVLRQKELELELKFEASHRRLLQLAKLLHGSQVQISQAEFNIEKLSDSSKQVMLSCHLYDRMINNEITEQEALAMGNLTVTSPTLNFDLSSFDAVSDMVHTTNEEMEEFQAKLSELQMAGDDYEVEDVLKDDEEEKEIEAEVDNEEKIVATEPWDDVPFARCPAQNDPFAIGFVTADVKSPINPEDPFGQGAFAPPGVKPARPSRPPQPKAGGGAPPRPKSPAPSRSKSPAPPRPKSPANPKNTPPSRPPAPSKSPNPPSEDEEESFFAQIRGGGNYESNFADLPSDKFPSDYDLK